MTDHRRERDAFISAASEFCRIYEGAGELGSERFLLCLSGTLPRLQSAAAQLPYPDDADDIPDDDLDLELTEEEAEVVFRPVRDILNEIDWEGIRGYLRESRPAMTASEAIEEIEHVRELLPESVVAETDWDAIRDNLRTYLPETHSPNSPAPLPVDLFLHEDLYETYRGVKHGFRLLEAGRPEAEAVFYWRLSFWAEWGYGNADALRLIHYYVALYLAG
jgi:hypothetical protein